MNELIVEYRDGPWAARFFLDRFELEGPGTNLTLSPDVLNRVFSAVKVFQDEYGLSTETGPTAGEGAVSLVPEASPEG